MTDKPRRQRLIHDLVAQGGVANQDALAVLLKKRGLDVTQATLSRDLHELGIVKGPGGYALPGNGSAPEPRGLERALRDFLLRADTGGNLAILHTGPGRAPLLALEIDRASMKPILGTVAGDDTVFVATRSPREAGKLLSHFKQLAGLN
jgi:transcriptional regulator of arginine metabolism